MKTVKTGYWIRQPPGLIRFSISPLVFFFFSSNNSAKIVSILCPSYALLLASIGQQSLAANFLLYYHSLIVQFFFYFSYFFPPWSITWLCIHYKDEEKQWLNKNFFGMQSSFQPIWFCCTQIRFALQPAQQEFHLKSKTDTFMGLERNIFRNGEHLIAVCNDSAQMNNDHFCYSIQLS